MLKNRTIAIAASSALLSLSQVDATPAATPLATVRIASKSTNPPELGRAPDFDRAFIVQQTGEVPSGAHRTGKSLETNSSDRSPVAFRCVEPRSLGLAIQPSDATHRRTFANFTSASTDPRVERDSVSVDPRFFDCRER
jgi:hypothetical protein